MSKTHTSIMAGLAVSSAILVSGVASIGMLREGYAQGADISLDEPTTGCVTITTIRASTVSCPGGFIVTIDGTLRCTFDKETGIQRCTFD